MGPRGMGESVTQAPHSTFSPQAPFEMSDESPESGHPSLSTHTPA